MKKILYTRLYGNKLQGEFREFDINNLEENIKKINEKNDGKFLIYGKAKIQSKKLSEAEINSAPNIIFIKKGDD